MKTGTAQVNGRGGRPTEDRVIVKELSGGATFAAVFDGHSGAFTVNFTVKKLWEAVDAVLTQAGEDETAIRAGLQKAFIEHDRLIAQQGVLHYRDSGSTASCCILTKKHLIFAHIGDSPGFVFRPDTGAVLFELKPHLPNVPEEKARIERAGGYVSKGSSEEPPRVDGQLMVSRAFGDYELKFENRDRPEFEKDWARDFKVVAQPDIHIMERPTTGMVVLCSDGVVETSEDMKFRTAAEVARSIQEARDQRPNGSLSDVADLVLERHIQAVAGDYKVYKEREMDDLSLVLVDCSFVAAGGGSGGLGAFTRKSKRRRRMRTGKRKLPKRIYI